MRMKAFGWNAAAVAASAKRAAPGSIKPITSPPPIAALHFKKSRRDSLMMDVAMSSLLARHVRGSMDRGADLAVGAAATDISRHRGVDIGVGRIPVLGEQRRRAHDLDGLAIAALRHVHFKPG